MKHMITVSIAINAQAILTRSATNTGQRVGDQTVYLTDAGDEILHKPDDGAVVLAKKMLDTIKEQK